MIINGFKDTYTLTNLISDIGDGAKVVIDMAQEWFRSSVPAWSWHKNGFGVHFITPSQSERFSLNFTRKVLSQLYFTPCTY